MIKLNFPDYKYARDEIREKGFCIIKEAIPKEFIYNQKERWITFIKKENVNKSFVRGNFFLGETNFLSYSDIPSWCMYRNYEFLWNKNLDENAMSVHLSIHKFRNQIQELESNYGLNYNSKNYGIYISTSLYESNKGHLIIHPDGHADQPILHYMLPFSFKKIDYETGGLVCEDNNGQMHDIDSIVSPGDIIFFDGRKRHGVTKIESNNPNHIGRLASFAIPTFFSSEYGLRSSLRTLKVSLLELANKLKIITLK
jgi:hypothetical protein